MRFSNYILLAISILCFSCSQPKEEKPQGILEQDVFVNTLVDVHLLEASLQLNLLEGLNDSLNIKDYYLGLFDGDSLQLNTFRESFSYYAQNPKNMEAIYDSVLQKIQMLDVQ